mmetsp:Transcript_14230/g.29116  ORF Transcript_14230/g.29116 Transcript_14230/m.29116 type:complete len:118 (-) Transcript_14230:458-811(-)
MNRDRTLTLRDFVVAGMDTFDQTSPAGMNEFQIGRISAGRLKQECFDNGEKSLDVDLIGSSTRPIALESHMASSIQHEPTICSKSQSSGLPRFYCGIQRETFADLSTVNKKRPFDIF